MTDEKAYLSVVQWPDGWVEAQIVEALAAAAGIDPATGRLIARRGVPAVIARVDALVASDIVREFRARGVMAFAPTQSQLAGLPEPHRVKRLELDGEGGIRAELWRGEARPLRVSESFLIVRASVRTVETRTDSGRPARGSSVTAGWMLGGVVGAAVASSLGGGGVKSTRTRATELIDIFLGSGERFRCNGDKFNFDVLGDQRGITDRENMAKLTDLLRHLAPRTIFDADFEAFTSPADISDVRTIGGTRRQTSEAPAFDFYAAWAFLLYRTLLNSRR